MKILLLLITLTMMIACSTSTEPVNFKYHIQNPHPVPKGDT